MEYWQDPAQTPGTKKKNRLSVGMGLFLTCIVLTTLIGLFAGLLISNFTHDSYLTADRGSQEQQTVQSQPESSDGTAQTPSGSSDAQGVLTTTPVLKNDSQYTKAEIIEKCAPSVEIGRAHV
mgnify:FL=1